MKMEQVPGPSSAARSDLVLLAMGFVHVEHGKIIQELGVEYDPRGNIRCNPDYSTSVKGVFAAGMPTPGPPSWCGPSSTAARRRATSTST